MEEAKLNQKNKQQNNKELHHVSSTCNKSMAWGCGMWGHVITHLWAQCASIGICQTCAGPIHVNASGHILTAYQQWRSLLNGLLLTKEQETQSWTWCFTDHHVIWYWAHSPVPIHPQPPTATLQPTLCLSWHDQWAHSMSPLPMNWYPTAAYLFTFAPPVSESHSNPFTLQVKIEHYGHPSYLLPPPTNTSPTKPSTINQSIINAFSPLLLILFKLAKYELPSVQWMNIWVPNRL